MSLLSSHFLTIFLHGSFRERAKRASQILTFLRRKHTILFNSLLVKLIFVDTCPCVRNTHDYGLFNDEFFRSENEKTRFVDTCPCVRNIHDYGLFNDEFYKSENEKL